jgi:hypothetical protein
LLEQKYDDASGRAGVEGEKEPPESIEYPIVRKKFRVTIDVEATLAAEPRGGELPPLRRACPTPGRLWNCCRPNPSSWMGSSAAEPLTRSSKRGSR